MGHHHHRRKDRMDSNNNDNSINNMDVSSIPNLINNNNLNQALNSLGGTNNQSIQNLLKGVDVNQISSLLSQLNLSPQYEGNVLSDNDPRREILNSLKSFLPENRCRIIDEIINLYSLKTVIDNAIPQNQNKKPSNNTNNDED
ncbi:hypothetical protein Q428_05015 [Fervidicella metallireducens AeB]|uniref:Uncharacterized protein n=1 Tax=Fervidicella metallireducens AeB TaxID=1403537 RepID=A0A017RWK4_9CLOT|nr:hypothetical protein [Fervidicella metallireducens]EYE89027.1 hypothetical protein Q428_05015 [Fervidicella metallireducens AeB]